MSTKQYVAGARLSDRQLNQLPKVALAVVVGWLLRGTQELSDQPQIELPWLQLRQTASDESPLVLRVRDKHQCQDLSSPATRRCRSMPR
jgi:hypothetical protein